MADNNNVKIKLPKVRLSYPYLFSPYKEGDKYSCKMMLDVNNPEHKKVIAQLEKAIKKVASDKFDKPPKSVLPYGAKCCLINGDDHDMEDYDGHVIVSASSKPRPPVVDRHKNPLAEADNVIYAGCFANVTIDLWVMDSPEFGKRVCANLRAVQFYKDGERFGAKPVDADDEFDVEDDDDFGGDDEEF